MKRKEHREFILNRMPVPALDDEQYVDFCLLIQRAVLYSLEERGLLYASQREQAVQMLEQRYGSRQNPGQ